MKALDGPGFIMDAPPSAENFIQCNVCKKYFVPKKEARYTVVKENTLLDNYKVFYDAFDCAYCGCQHIANERLAAPDAIKTK